MAHIMRTGQQKDNFYVKARSAIQDTVAMFYVVKNIASNTQIEFYLPSLVEMIGDLVDAERCAIYLYDRA